MLLSSFYSGGVDSSLQGVYAALPVKCMVYGRGCTRSLPKILSHLGVSKAFIITGTSLKEKTPVIKDLEAGLGPAHVGTYSKVRQHAPIADIEAATSQFRESGADVLISVGGGSPIDAAKAVAFHIHEQTGSWVPSVAVPTTLSVAETTQGAGFTDKDGHKVAVADPELAPKAILYDGDLALYTPTRLWLSSAIRAIDHAVELQYNPVAPEFPTKRLCLEALRELFHLLPLCHQNPSDADIRQKLLLAAYSSLFSLSFVAAIGLSHKIGHAIGATYGIPHGITSCISLAPTVHFKADRNPNEAKQIARILPYIGRESSGDPTADAHAVGDAIDDLIGKLGLRSTLTDYNVSQGEVEAIALRVLGGNKEHPDFAALRDLIRGLYDQPCQL
ncbi:hypothetical protein VTO42DRAFT_6011 [Malbranchea cinnamomea]